MRLLHFVLPSLGLLSAQTLANPTFLKRGLNFVTTESKACTADQRALIETEIGYAQAMALYASEHLTDAATITYYESLYGASSRAGSGFADNRKAIYSRLSSIADSAQTQYVVQVTCDDTTKKCKYRDEKGQPGYVASMAEATKTMNFCDIFFTGGFIKKTSDIIANAKSSNSNCRSLQDFRMTMSGVILHEFTHTTYGMNTANAAEKSHDYAYNVPSCLKLAAGTYDRSTATLGGKTPLCPDPTDPKKEGVCDPKKAAVNADSIMLVAAGLWFSNQTGNIIPVQVSSGTSRLVRNLDSGTLTVRNITNTTTMENDFCNITLDSLAIPLSWPQIDIESTSNSTTDTSTATSLPCYNYADPDGGEGNFCTCSNGVSTPIASSTGTNTGSNYQPCPWTTAPTSTSTSAQLTAAPTITSPPVQYPFTQTLYGTVIECESSLIEDFGVGKETICAGGRVTLSVPPSSPSVSVQGGLNKVNVGTLTSSALYTSVSSALDKLCPTPTDSSFASCATGNVAIKEVDYISGGVGIDVLETNGELVVSVGSSTYNDPNIRIAMIKAAALNVMTSANNTNCHEETHYIDYFREPLAKHTTLCNAVNYAGVEYYATGGANTMHLALELAFEVYEGGEFECELMIDLLEMLLIEIAPEFAIEDKIIGDAIHATCEESDD